MPLTVADLDRSIGWYRSILRMRVHRRHGGPLSQRGTSDTAAVVIAAAAAM